MCKADIHHPNWDLAAFALNRQKEKKKQKKEGRKRGGSGKGGRRAATTVQIWDSLTALWLCDRNRTRSCSEEYIRVWVTKRGNDSGEAGRRRAEANKCLSLQPRLHRCSALPFIPQPFIKCSRTSLLIYNTANLLSSHLTVQSRPELWAFNGENGETCLYLP